jgi:hypothetical protein
LEKAMHVVVIGDGSQDLALLLSHMAAKPVRTQKPKGFLGLCDPLW